MKTRNKKIIKKRSKIAPQKQKKIVPEHRNRKFAPAAAHTPGSRGNVYIIGESPLVEQYAQLCVSSGYAVAVYWNILPLEQKKLTSAGIKISQAIPANTSVAIEATNIDAAAKRKNLERIAQALPATAPILSSSLTVTATEQSGWISGKHRLIGISAFPGFVERPLVEIAPTIYSPKETVEVILRFYHSLGKEIEIVQDRIGMVFPRMICQVINEAAFAITEDAAAPNDIDKIMIRGMQHPRGPIQWAEEIGFDQVHAVLKALHMNLQEERYRTAPLLQQLSLTGVWWKQETPIQTKE